jgi:cellulose synthase (UDP-forming)
MPPKVDFFDKSVPIPFRGARGPGRGVPLNFGDITMWLILFLLFSVSYLVVGYERRFSPEHQMVIGYVALFSLIAFTRHSAFSTFPGRLLFIFASFFLSVRYMLWRVFDTLIYTGPLDQVAMSLLFLAEFHSIVIHLLSMFINIWPYRRADTPPPVDEASLPTVDIFIAAYTEDLEIIRITATAAMQIDYPADRYKVYICHDGGTVARRNNPALAATAWERHYALKRLAADIGAEYLTRETNVHAKAGNINHALRHSGNDLVLILDCDHVPTRDILRNTVGAFVKDPRLSLVQTPHFFINPTPVEKQVAGVSNVSVENDMFFQDIHAGLDFWNASYFCGSAALLRRSVLEEIGGISGETITEDAETSYLMHSLGYNSAYINRPMVCGLSPETFDAYVTQRVRWAQGMLQLFFLKNALVEKGLSFSQRLCYFNSSFFWLFGLPRFIFYVAPAMYLIFGLKIYHASLNQVLAYGVPFIVSTFFVMHYFYGKTRQPFFSEIYESVQGLFLIPAILSVIINPKAPVFKITAKGEQVQENFINPLASSFLLVILINMVAIPLAIHKWFAFPTLRGIIIVVAIWCVYNVMMSLVALGAFWEKKQVRRHHRLTVKESVTLTFVDRGETVEATVRDISLMGVGVDLRPPREVAAGERVVVVSTDSYGYTHRLEGEVRRGFVRRTKTTLGVLWSLEKAPFADLVRYTYGDSERWEGIWRREPDAKDTPRILFLFMRMGVAGYYTLSKSILMSLAQRTRRRFAKAT